MIRRVVTAVRRSASISSAAGQNSIFLEQVGRVFDEISAGKVTDDNLSFLVKAGIEVAIRVRQAGPVGLAYERGENRFSYSPRSGEEQYATRMFAKVGIMIAGVLSEHEKTSHAASRIAFGLRHHLQDEHIIVSAPSERDAGWGEFAKVIRDRKASLKTPQLDVSGAANVNVGVGLIPEVAGHFIDRHLRVIAALNNACS